MACKFIILLAAMVAVTNSAVVPVAPAVPVLAKLEDFDASPQYTYSYDVQDAITGDSKAQTETRNGDIVQGSYSLIDADGFRRIVEYTADPVNGFNAVVSREPALAAVAVAPSVGVVPVAPVAGAAPAPAVPENGPDSDVEVVEARSGPLKSAPAPAVRSAAVRAAPVSAKVVAPAVPVVASTPVRAVAAPLAYTAYPSAALTTNVFQRYTAPVANAIATPVVAKAALTYPAYSAYSAAYSSPFAYTVPAGGFAYAPALA